MISQLDLTRPSGKSWEVSGKASCSSSAESSRGGLYCCKKTLDTCDQTGWRICNAEFLGALAQGLAGLGELDEALVTADKALTTAGHAGDDYAVSELLRIKGEVLLQQAGDQSIAAEDCFQGALEIAQQQDAVFWELRVALSLARLRIGQNRQNDAREILAPTYDRFTEGFDTADLKQARSLLQQMG